MNGNRLRHRWTLVGWLAVLALAAVIRTGYWIEVRDLPLMSAPTGDAATYVNLAEAMGQDGPLAPRGQAYTQAPLYPFFLYALGRLGLDLSAVRWIQIVLGVLVVALLGWIGWRLGGRLAGFLTGLTGAVYGPLVFFGAELLSITLAISLFSAALLCWGNRRWSWVAGLALGLAALAQPNLLLAALLIVVWSLWRPRDLGFSTRAPILTLALGMALPILISGARNIREAKEPVLISVNGGVNFFIGNNPKATGVFRLPVDTGLLNRPEGLFTSAREVAEEERGGSLPVTAVDRYWWRRGFSYWLSQPADALGLAAKKALLVLNNYEIPNHFDYSHFRRRSTTLRMLPTLGWILPFAGMGLLALWRRGSRGPLIWLGALTVSVGVFFVTARYRLPVVTILIPAAGVGLAVLWENRRRYGRLGGYAAVGAAYAGLAFLPLVGGTEASTAHMYNLEGATLYQAGDVDGAAVAFARALEVSPGHAEALNNLGKMRLLQGRTPEAKGLFERAVRANPSQAETYFNWEELLRAEGDPRRALSLLDNFESVRQGRIGDVASALDYRRGLCLLALGDTSAARDRFVAATTAPAPVAGGWFGLATLERDRKRWPAAAAAARRGLTLSPNHRNGLLTFGIALRETGDLAQATTVLRRAWALDPDHPEAPYELGVLHENTGDLGNAEAHFHRAATATNYPPALLGLGRVYEATGRPQDAVTAYRLLIKNGGSAPEVTEAHDRLAAVTRRLGDER